MQWQLPHLANDCMFGRDRPNNKSLGALTQIYKRKQDNEIPEKRMIIKAGTMNH